LSRALADADRVSDISTGGWEEVIKRVAALAERQWGHITTRQLLGCGLSHTTIGRWTRRGTLRRVHGGVYAVGHRSPAPEARWAAALLACGVGAALSDISAAALHGLLLDAGHDVHVTVENGALRRAGIVVHRRSLGGGEVVRMKGLRVTTIPRTLLDLAAAGVAVDRIIEEAIARRLVSLRGLRAYVARRQGVAGVAALRTAVEGPRTRSRLERRFRRWLAAHDLPLPLSNHTIGPYTVDAFWPDAGLVVEVDTLATHGTPLAFERDRRRDAYLAARGLRTIRVTDERMATDGARLARDLRRALDTA
jgi:very-short-patch-repair endonuclease/predicted transcriptional regulator of viral defense system